MTTEKSEQNGSAEATAPESTSATPATTDEVEGTPWWMRTPTPDPSGDPAHGTRPRAAALSEVSAPTAAAPRSSSVTGWVPDGGLSRALSEERQRLIRERDDIEARRRHIEAQIESVDARIGHVDALLAADPMPGPPAELPRIGRPRAEAA